jgi:hypothetical protein
VLEYEQPADRRELLQHLGKRSAPVGRRDVMEHPGEHGHREARVGDARQVGFDTRARRAMPRDLGARRGRLEAMDRVEPLDQPAGDIADAAAEIEDGISGSDAGAHQALDLVARAGRKVAAAMA